MLTVVGTTARGGIGMSVVGTGSPAEVAKEVWHAGRIVGLIDGTKAYRCADL